MSNWLVNYSLRAGAFRPSYYKQVEEQAPKIAGWLVCFLLMILVLATILILC